MQNKRRYTFVTEWRFAAPRERVFAEINAPDAWPSWWRGVLRVEKISEGDARGIGAVRRYVWRSRLPYRLSFTMRATHVEEPARLEGEAFGELTGHGTWTFRDDGRGGTLVRYDWQVDATKRWMRVLEPVARPFFVWNHDVVMRWGYEGLRRRLGEESPAV